MSKYFNYELPSTKADVERHRVEEQLILDKIKELEESPSDYSEVYLKAYRGFLFELQQSKADVVNKIGRKK